MTSSCCTASSYNSNESSSPIDSKSCSDCSSSHHRHYRYHHHHDYHQQQQQQCSRSKDPFYSCMRMMPRSTLFILVKYAVFLNWTLTGFWIIYNSSDYSKNAQIISEKISSYSDEIEKESVVYWLICYTITLSCITFFGLVGVCYENFKLTISLAIGYVIYIVFDILSNALLGVPFNSFFIFLQIMLTITCLNLFCFAFLIRYNAMEENQLRTNFSLISHPLQTIVTVAQPTPPVVASPSQHPPHLNTAIGTTTALSASELPQTSPSSNHPSDRSNPIHERNQFLPTPQRKQQTPQAAPPAVTPASTSRSTMR